MYSQLFNESKKIRDQFGYGIISPEIANQRWEKLQKKYGDNPTTIENYGWQALTYINKGENTKAINLFKIGLEKAIVIKNDSLYFKYLSNLSSIYRYSGEFELAESTFQKAYQLYKLKPKIIFSIPEYSFSLFNNYGKFKQEKGDIAESIDYFNIAKKIAEPVSLDRSKPFIYGNIASYYLERNQLIEAKSNLLEAIKYPSNYEDIADKYLKLAEIEEKKNDLLKMAEMINLAEANFNKSVKRKAGSIFPLYEIGVLIAKGNLNKSIKNLNKAHFFYDESIKLALKYFKTNTSTKNLVQSHKLKAILFSAQQNHPAALKNLQKALQYNSTNFKSENIADNPKLEDIKYKNDALEIFKEKISALLGIYKKEGKKEYLDYALRTVVSVNELINYQRNSFQLEGSKLFLSEQAHAIYGLAIEAAFEKFKVTHDEQFINLAYTYSESNKAVVLFESIKAQNANTFVGVPQELLNKEITAIKNIAIYENQLYKDAKNEDQWRKKLIEVTDELAKLKEKFKTKYPQYYQYKYNNEPITIAETKAKLYVNQSVIEYFIIENTLYTFLITKENAKFFRQILPANFNQSVFNYKNLILGKSIGAEYKNLSNILYKTLFNVEILAIFEKDKINNIKIIGDGVINFIPMEALLTKPVKSLKETDIYLIERYTIGYLPSATMNWKNTKPKESKWFPDTYIGFAPSYKNGLNLPDNQANVSNLAIEFSGESVLYKDANIQNFNEYSSKNSKILHLSMHGGASEINEMESFLAFENDSLFVHDIYTKNIPADLAILDACETGMGILNNGEGILSLARAFLHAGSQAVAMSLWKLSSSAETAQIVSDFANLVIDSTPKDIALSQAKLNYLTKNRQDLNLSHPFYWAPLIIVGNAEPIEPNYYKYWLVLFVLLIAYSYSSYRNH